MDVCIIVRTRRQMERVIEQIKRATNQETRSEWRRGQCRVQFATPGTVSHNEPSHSSQPIYISTYDISVGGLGFFSSRDLHPGEKLLVAIETDFGDLEIPATVMRSTGTLGHYRIGVRFDLEND